MDSGLLTAVGMCIESTWRTTPATTNQIGATGNPHRFWKVEADGGIQPRLTIDNPYNEIDGDISLIRSILQSKDYDGRFGFKVDPENLMFPLLGMLGRDLQAQLTGTGTTSNLSPSFSHTMTPQKKVPSFSLEEKYGLNADHGKLSSGCLINRLDFTFGKTLMAEMGLVAFRQVPNQYQDGSGNDTLYDFINSAAALPSQMGSASVMLTTAPVYVDVAPANTGDGPLVFARMPFGTQAGFGADFVMADVGSGMAAIAGGITILEGHTLNIIRDIEATHVSGSQFDPGEVTGNAFHVGGSMTMVVRSNIIPKNVLSRAKFGINFRHTGISIGTSGNRYTLEIYMPRVRFQEAPVANPAGGMTITGPYVAEKDPSLGYEILFILTNTYTNVAVTGGLVASAPGGLSGWINT